VNGLDMLYLGALVGAAFMATCWVLDRQSFESYLKRKAEPAHRTPVKIEDEFFYIVPEREFVAIRLRALRPPTELEPTYGMGMGAGREKAPRG
jgi:hypothetical protein